MSEFGYGQLAYLAVPPGHAAEAASVHHRLALAGVIVVDPEPIPAADADRASVAALERAKVRAADFVAVVHPIDGCPMDGRWGDLVGYAEQLGKRIRHYGVDASGTELGWSV
jgi:hypothetical protein